MYNKETIIIFEVLNKKRDFNMLNKEMKKEKKHLEKELLFFLNYHKEVSGRSEKTKAYFDEQINIIVERLKEIGH